MKSPGDEAAVSPATRGVRIAEPLSPTPGQWTERPRLHSSCSRPSIADKLSQMNLSFAGCGFLSVYHVGVAACMRRYCPDLFNNRISGASAGALAAAALICDTSLSSMMSELVQLVTNIQNHLGGPFSPFVNITNMLRSNLEKTLPDDAHIRCSGRLHISVTRLQDSKNCILSQFESKQQLIEALLCTCFIPIFSGWRPPLFCGVRYMDGCYSNNLPTMDSRTITVSPFCGEADVCPRDNSLSLIVVDVANTLVEMSVPNLTRMRMIMYPPSPEALSDLANEGFNDGIRFLMRHDLLKCQVCVLTTEIVGRAYSGCGQLIQHKHCSQCMHKQQEALVARLPDAVYEPLHNNINSARHQFRNWILDFPVIRHMLVIALPWSVPYHVLRALYLRLVSRLPLFGRMLEKFASEVIQALHSGFSGHLPEFQHLHTNYKCSLNFTEYGESAISDTESEMSCGSDQVSSAPYVPGIVRQFNREFQVEITNNNCGTPVVRTRSDADLLESVVPSSGGARDPRGPRVQVADPMQRLQVPSESMDREMIELALQAQSQADCGVSWYYTDKRGNVRVKHVSAVSTPVVTPCASRRASVCDDGMCDLATCLIDHNFLGSRHPPSSPSSASSSSAGSGPLDFLSEGGSVPVRRGSLDSSTNGSASAWNDRRRSSMDSALLLRRSGLGPSQSWPEEDQRPEHMKCPSTERVSMLTITEETNEGTPDY
nr:Bmm-like protein 2 [Parasacculina yatsui]